MSFPLTLLIVVNFIYIGILPRIFFRSDGKFNLMWWLTAFPLFMNSIVVVLGHLGILNPTFDISELVGQSLAVVLSFVSIVLISMTLGTHRIPLALWHQENDAPKQIVTWGAYKYIRHPFYTSFMIAEIASVFYFFHWVNILGVFLCFFILNKTAKREEGRLSQSEYGNEYREYLKVTARFFPKIF